MINEPRPCQCVKYMNMITSTRYHISLRESMAFENDSNALEDECDRYWGQLIPPQFKIKRAERTSDFLIFFSSPLLRIKNTFWQTLH